MVDWELDPIQLLKALLPGRGAGYASMMVMIDGKLNKLDHDSVILARSISLDKRILRNTHYVLRLPFSL
jgi:hypothetical protein